MPSRGWRGPVRGTPGEGRGAFPASPITSFCAGLGTFPPSPPPSKLAAAPAASPGLAQVCPQPRQAVQGRGWNGVGLRGSGQPLLPLPAPCQTSTGLGRAEGGPLLSPGFLRPHPSTLALEPPAPPSRPTAWHLVWVLQSWAPGPGLRTCEPQLCVDLSSRGGA